MTQKICIVLLLIIIATSSMAAQCAMCRAVLESEADGGAAKGINNGIVYLMVFPYLLIGVVGYFIFKMRQKAKKDENSSFL